MTSTWEELKFYGRLASSLFAPKHDLHNIPGPKGYPLVGNIPSVLRPDYHVPVLEWANEYGGVCAFSLAYQWIVLVSDPQAAAQVLGRGERSLPRKSIGYAFFDIATNNMGRHSFFTTTDEAHWANLRKAVAPAFSVANVKRCLPSVMKHSEVLCKQLEAEASRSAAQEAARRRRQQQAELAAAEAAAAAAAAAASTSKAGASSSLFWMMQPTVAYLSGAASTAGTWLLPSSSWLALPWRRAAAVAQPKDADSAAAGRGGGGSAPAAAQQPGAASSGLAAAASGAGDESVLPDGDAAAAGASALFATADIQHDLELLLLKVFIEALFCVDLDPDSGNTTADGGGSNASPLQPRRQQQQQQQQQQRFPCEDVAHAMNTVLEEANKRLKTPLRKLVQSVVQPTRERSIRSAQALLNDAYGVLADHVLKHRDSTDSSSSSLGLSSGGGGSSGVRSSGISSVWAAAFGRKKSASRKGAADAASEAAGTTAAASSALAAAADTGLVACLARMRHHKTGKLFSRNEMIPEIGALMMAGFDTSSHTIAWCLFALATHPDIQLQVHQELEAAGLMSRDAVRSAAQHCRRAAAAAAAETADRGTTSASAAFAASGIDARLLTSPLKGGSKTNTAAEPVLPVSEALVGSSSGGLAQQAATAAGGSGGETAAAAGLQGKAPDSAATGSGGGGGGIGGLLLSVATLPLTVAVGTARVVLSPFGVGRRRGGGPAAAAPSTAAAPDQRDGARKRQEEKKMKAARGGSSQADKSRGKPAAAAASELAAAAAAVDQRHRNGRKESQRQMSSSSRRGGSYLAAEPSGAAADSSGAATAAADGHHHKRLSNGFSAAAADAAAAPSQYEHEGVIEAADAASREEPSPAAAAASAARAPAYEDLSRLSYLNAVIDESMRMFPVAATASVREVVKPTQVGDYVVPRGVIVWPCLYALHNSVHNWDLPHEFRPERFLDKSVSRKQSLSVAAAAQDSGSSAADATEASADDNANGGAAAAGSSSSMPSSSSASGATGRKFLPFSDGMKSCLGQNLGLMEVRAVLVALLSRFWFDLHPSMGGAEHVKDNMVMSLTLKIKGGLKLTCRPLLAPLPPASE